MATRFYLPGSGAPAAPVTVTPSASWNVTTSFDSRPTSTTKSNQAVTTAARAKGSVTANNNRLDVQFISSRQLAVQTIAIGTFSAVVRAVESVATENAWLQVIIRVVDSTGATVRGTIYSGQTQTTTPSVTVGAVNEEYSTTSATRIISALATTASVTTVAGDRIVIEIGARIGGTTSADTFNHRYADVVANADFALTSGLVTDLDPWVELSQTLVWVDQTSSVAATAAMTASITGPVDTISSNVAATAAMTVANSGFVNVGAGPLTVQSGRLVVTVGNTGSVLTIQTGTPDATAAMTAAVSGFKSISSTAAATAALTAAVTSLDTLSSTLSASLAASAAVTSAITRIGILSASLASTASVAGLKTISSTVAASVVFSASVTSLKTISSTVATTAAMTASVTGLKTITSALSASLTAFAGVSGTETHTGTLTASAGLSAVIVGLDLITPTEAASLVCSVITTTGASATLAVFVRMTADAANVFAGFPYFPGCPVIVTVLWERGGVTMDPQLVGGVVVQKVIGQAVLVSPGPGEIGLVPADKTGVAVIAEELAGLKLAPC